MFFCYFIVCEYHYEVNKLFNKPLILIRCTHMKIARLNTHTSTMRRAQKNIHKELITFTIRQRDSETRKFQEIWKKYKIKLIIYLIYGVEIYTLSSQFITLFNLKKMWIWNYDVEYGTTTEKLFAKEKM